MDQREYIDDFEDFLQENADQHKLYPSDAVWAGIHRTLHPKRKWSYLAVGVIFLGLGIGGKIFDTQFAINPTSIASSTIQFIEQPSEIDSNLGRQINADIQTSHIGTQKTNRIVQLADRSEDQKVTTEAATPLFVDEESKAIEDITIVESHQELSSLQKVNLPAIKNSKTISIISSETTSPIPTAKLTAEKGLKYGWQFYISPTTSYRRLSGKGLPYYTNAGSNMTSVFSANDIERSVTHKPSIGFEIGGAVTYQATNSLRFKAGVQINVNRYEVQAFHSVPEVAPMTPNTGSGSINVVSTFRNYSGFSKTWLKNQHIMMSFPVGAEIKVLGNENISFNIAGTLQPTIVLNNQAYMISTNMRNYAKAPSLYREFNVAGGAEAFVSIKRKNMRWNVGPQFRYQLISSYKKPYPISEHLTDYGLKVSIGR